ncbi:MAG: hypothetical protein IJY09_10165 [Lachnospiraceae bacterium]|nr:hypothetical protein [Lachnospiraceae bacterium]
MGTNHYKDDLKYLYSALLNHPSIITAEKKKSELDALYFDKCNVVCDFDHFIDAATELTCFFEDGHTNIELPYTSQDLCCKLKCYWDEMHFNELILKEAYEDIPEYARITSVEGNSIEELITTLTKQIPHENIYLVKSRMIQYPYQNYHLFSAMNLKRLFGVKKNYSICSHFKGQWYCNHLRSSDRRQANLLWYAQENAYAEYQYSFSSIKMLFSASECKLG